LNRAEVLLQQLYGKLGTWLPAIRRATGAADACFVPRPGGEFNIRVEWKLRDGVGVYEKEFTKAYVFGGTFHRPQAEWHIEKRACDHARDIMREVLALRGVL
jgi:hypothetical protein